MKNKLKRLAVLTTVLLLLITPLSGCSKWRYGAKMYSSYATNASNALVKEEFINQNKIYGGRYPNPNYYGEGLETEDEKDLNNYSYLDDTTSPESRTFIITDRETFDSIYVEDALEVDFDKQMVILYLHLKSTGRLKCYDIDKIKIDEKQATIYYKKKEDHSNKKGGSGRYKWCTTVVMKKMDITSVEFVFIED